MNTLDSKSDEEKMRINRSKAFSSGCISKVERAICKELGMESQHVISHEKGYVYDMRRGMKIIEYHGDYWHYNPEKYDSDFYNKSIKMYAHEKWEVDKEKYKFAVDNGYEVLVIWESDYKRDQQKVIQECLEFLKS